MFKEVTGSRNASENETVSFECAARGDPKPSVTFYKNGRRARTIPIASHHTLRSLQRLFPVR